MKSLRTIYMLTLVSVALTLLISHSVFPEETGILGWVYPKAFDVKKKADDKNRMQFLYYRVKAEYPSLEVYDYYGDILEQRGYKRMNWEDQNLNVWSSFIDGTRKGAPVVYEFRAIWADEERKEMFILSLRYYSESSTKQNAPDSKIQHVHFQKRPYYRIPRDETQHK